MGGPRQDRTYGHTHLPDSRSHAPAQSDAHDPATLLWSLQGQELVGQGSLNTGYVCPRVCGYAGCLGMEGSLWPTLNALLPVPGWSCEAGMAGMGAK